MAVLNLLKEIYAVRGLPQGKSGEIFNLIKDFEGAIDNMENEDDTSFRCIITLPPNKQAFVQAKLTAMLDGTE